MSEVQKFQHIIDRIREDLTFIENLYWKLNHLLDNPLLRSDFSYEKIITLRGVRIQRVYTLYQSMNSLYCTLIFIISAFKVVSPQ